MFQGVNDEATNIQVPTLRCAMDGRCAESVGRILVCNLVLLKGLDDGAAHFEMSFAGRQMEWGVAREFVLAFYGRVAVLIFI